MVTARDVAAAVVDPELRVVTIDDLGILRDVSDVDGRVVVTITPTYTGCPAIDQIRSDITRSLDAAGSPDADLARDVLTALKNRRLRLGPFDETPPGGMFEGLARGGGFFEILKMPAARAK